MNNISIIGTAGIPANYGGFETLAEYLAKYLSYKLDITVYCSAKYYDKKITSYNNAQLRYIPLSANGIQSIPYDIISLFYAAYNNDTILILGVSGCIILPLFRIFYPYKRLLVNIDGLEHQRGKWKKPIQKFLKFSEKQAIKYSNVIIADNYAIQKYIDDVYDKESLYIAYGGDHALKLKLSKEVLEYYSIPDEYTFKVCRIEPENNIHIILEAFSKISLALVIVGNWERNEYGIGLKNQYNCFDNLFMLDPIYDQNILDQIRSNCKVYIHGHSAGGTNPSLVEAMYLGLPIFAFDVIYNRETTKNQAMYFKSSEDLCNLIENTSSTMLTKLSHKMKEIADSEYTWNKIANKYLKLFNVIE